MAVRVFCAHCKTVSEDWESYANHVLAKHKDDKARCEWAKNALETRKKADANA